jgi:hypothetical protein
MNNRDNNGKLMRWSLIMQEFNFEIIHKTGKSNKVADALSKNPVEVNAFKVLVCAI